MYIVFASVVLWRNVFLPDITVMVDGVKKQKQSSSFPLSFFHKPKGV